MFLPWPCGKPGSYLKIGGVLGVAAVLCSCFAVGFVSLSLREDVHEVFNSGSNTDVQMPDW